MVRRIINGKIITEQEVLEGLDLLVLNDRVLGWMAPDEADRWLISEVSEEDWDKDIETIDATGCYVMPGLIDIHSDYIEHIASPRPTSMMDFDLSLRISERELITHGITTMFHSLSLYKSYEFAYKPIRLPENVRRLVDEIHLTHGRDHLIRHRFHARYEIDNIDQLDQLKDLIEEGKVHLLSFMDHTPGQGQYRDLSLYRKTLKGYNNLSDQEIDTIIVSHQQKDKVSYDQLQELCELARHNHISVASHDDDSDESVDLVCELGVTISEFPVTLDVAKTARSRGLMTMAGAPNILLGGSHSGNLSAAEAILDGSIDILCSDYYPAAMLQAVFQMHLQHHLDLPSLIRLVTANPARAVQVEADYGTIAPGKKADLLVVDLRENKYPVVKTALVDGQPMLRTCYRQN